MEDHRAPSNFEEDEWSFDGWKTVMIFREYMSVN